MAAGFSFEVKGLDRLLKIFNQLPQQVQSEMGAELEITANEIRDGAKRDAPVDEARVRNSISTQKNSITEFTTVAQSSYAGYLEFGTKTYVSVPAGLEDVAGSLKGPGEGSGNPYEALQGWVKRKGIAGTYSIKTKRLSKSKKSQDNIKMIAFIIWRHIKKFGIKPHPFFFKQLPEAESKLKQRVANIIKQII